MNIVKHNYTGNKYLVICGSYREFNEFCDEKECEFEESGGMFGGDEYIYCGNDEYSGKG